INQWRWEPIDTAINRAEELGIEVLAILSYSAGWASSGSNSRYVNREQYDAAWANYVHRVVNRYKGKVDYWEIWNEPDHNNFLLLGGDTWAENHYSIESLENQRRLQYQHLVELALESPAWDDEIVTTSGFARGGDHDPDFL